MDVPYGLWAAVAGAAVAVAVVVIAGLLRVTADRGRGAGPFAAAVAGWLGAAFVLGGFGVFSASADSPVPLIGLGVGLPIVAGAWLLRQGGALHDLLQAASTPWLIGVQFYRVAGVLFLAAWALDLMPWQFALPAGVGDAIVGLSAPVVARRVARWPEKSRRLAMSWNLIGLADLAIAVATGFLTSPSPFQQLAVNDANTLITRLPFVLIPTFAVPLSVLLHLAAVRRLRAFAPCRPPATAAVPAPSPPVESHDRGGGEGPGLRMRSRIAPEESVEVWWPWSSWPGRCGRSP